MTFKITRHLWATCRSENTRYGFRHLATLERDYTEIGRAKACYYNRTWERYEFESVLESLLEQSIKAGYLSKYEIARFKHTIKTGGRHESRHLKTIAMVAKMGEILSSNQREANDFKTRILKAGLEGRGLIMPDDWDTLDEDTKTARLNGAISALSEEARQ